MTGMCPSVLQIGARWFPEVRTGLERYYYDLVHHLPAAGFEVRGLVLARARPSQRDGLAIDAYERPDTFIAKRILALRRAAQASIASHRPSLLACHYALYGLPIADAMRATPTVFHFHGPWAAEGQVERDALPVWLLKRGIEQVLYQKPAGFVVLSRAFRDILVEAYRVPPERIAVISGGVDVSLFESELDKTASRRVLGLATDRPIVLTIRRLVRRMGLENLITAMADVVRKFPDILLLIGGMGPLQQELEQQIAALELGKNIRLLGNVPDAQLPLLYRAADLSIVPSLTLEGFGLTTVESLACGTPVLVTPVGGLPEVAADLSPSLILPGSAPGILAEGMKAFFAGALAVPDAKACTDYVRQRFDWPIIARRIAALYTAILAQGHESRREKANPAVSEAVS